MRHRVLAAAVLACLILSPRVGLTQGKVAPAGAAPAALAAMTEGRARPADASPRSQDAARPRDGEAASVPEYRFAGAAPDRSLLWDAARMVFSLAAVLLLLGLGVKVARRWPAFATRDASAGALQVLGRLPLTAKEAVCLVRAGSDVLVVGVSPAGVSLLHRLEGGSADSVQPASASSLVGTSRRAQPLSGGRLRDLATRIRDVQAAWGIGPTDSRGER